MAAQASRCERPMHDSWVSGETEGTQGSPLPLGNSPTLWTVSGLTPPLPRPACLETKGTQP